MSARFLLASALVTITTFAMASPVAAQTRSVPAPSALPSLQGVWTLIPGASDTPPPLQRGGNQGRQGRGGGGGGPFGGGRRGGAFNPGPAPGTEPGGPGAPLDTNDPGAAAQQQAAMRDVMIAPQRLTIVQTATMIIITTNEGRTTRLAPTGKGIRDATSRIERKTKWDSGKLVSEITGPAGNTTTERYWVDTTKNQLHVQLMIPRRGMDPLPLNRLYDAADADPGAPR